MPDHPSNPAIRLLEGAFYAGDSEAHLRWMRENAPVYWDDTAGLWGISRHADVLEISRRPDIFCSGRSSRPDTPALPSMINRDDPQHRLQRSLVNRGFTPRRLEAQAPKIRRIASELIDRVVALGRCDFVQEVAAPLPMILIGDMLGVEPEDRSLIQRWSDDLIAATRSDAPEDAVARQASAFVEYAEYNRAVVADRRARPRDDLMSVLVRAEIDGEKLDDDQLLHESLLILVGGNETTRHVISGGMQALIRHPEQRRKLVEDSASIPTAVEEMLRWVTPIVAMNRTATRDVEFRGQKIAEGDRILLLYPSANRDAAVFDRPDSFEVTRSPNPHLAFGFGAHFCPGANLARLELRLLFEEIVRRIPDLRLISKEPLETTPSNFIRGIRSMIVEV